MASQSLTTEVSSVQSGSNGTSSASTMTSAAANAPSANVSTIAAGEEVRLCLGLLETLDQARTEYEVAMQQLKWVITRCRQSLELCGAQIQAQNQTQVAAIDLLADSLRRRMSDVHNNNTSCTVVDGHPNCPPSAKTDATCVGLPNTSQLSLSLFRRAIWQEAKTKPNKARSALSPVAPQVTGAVITPKTYFVPPPQRDREAGMSRSTRGKSDPLLRNILAAKPGSGDNTVLLTPSELMRNEWLKSILTAGNWKKTLEVAKSGTSVNELSSSHFAATLMTERKRTTAGASNAQQLTNTTTTGGQTVQTETGGDTDTGDPLSPMETELANGLMCFGDLLTPNVIDDLESSGHGEQENKQQQQTHQSLVHGIASMSYADRLACSVFEHLDSPVTMRNIDGDGCERGVDEVVLLKDGNIKSESSTRSSDTLGISSGGGCGIEKGDGCNLPCEAFSLVKSPSPRPAVNIRGRTEPLVRGLMTSELLKRAYLLGRDDYLFFEWMSPSESQWDSASIFPYGAFRAEIIFNTAGTEDVNSDNRDGDMLADETASSPDPANLDQCSRNSRFDPLCAQLIFEVETRPLEQCTREACCKAFRQLMDWAEDRVTQLKLPSPMSVAAGRSTENEGRNTTNSSSGVDDEWDGDFGTLSCLPLPQDYGRSELFDKRGSMRYIQLAATNPPIPVNMLDIKQKARNFNAWYTVQYGNGMWKAEVIVDQVNSKRNSFQRSLKQMSYQRAQLQVMRWLFKKCRDLKIATFRYKGRKDEYLVTVPPSSTAGDSLGYTLLECPESKRRKLEEESPDLTKRRRQG